VHLVQPQAGAARIRIETEGTDLRARIDGQRLTQAVMNLLLNALDADPQCDVRVRLCGRNSKVAIEVHDSGPGLSEDQRQHLFEAFYTTKPDGTGLGLAVSREFVAEMGGTLTYRNGSTGATFMIELPAVPIA
jgi:two-component system C4-dicarboxylate transport sensor histidine kinase DctB